MKQHVAYCNLNMTFTASFLFRNQKSRLHSCLRKSQFLKGIPFILSGLILVHYSLKCFYPCPSKGCSLEIKVSFQGKRLKNLSTGFFGFFFVNIFMTSVWFRSSPATWMSQSFIIFIIFLQNYKFIKCIRHIPYGQI